MSTLIGKENSCPISMDRNYLWNTTILWFVMMSQFHVLGFNMSQTLCVTIAITVCVNTITEHGSLGWNKIFIMIVMIAASFIFVPSWRKTRGTCDCSYLFFSMLVCPLFLTCWKLYALIECILLSRSTTRSIYWVQWLTKCHTIGELKILLVGVQPSWPNNVPSVHSKKHLSWCLI